MKILLKLLKICFLGSRTVAVTGANLNWPKRKDISLSHNGMCSAGVELRAALKNLFLKYADKAKKL